MLLVVVPVNVPQRTLRIVTGTAGLCSTGNKKVQISVEVVGVSWMLTELVVNELNPFTDRPHPKPRVMVVAAGVNPPWTPLILPWGESGAVGPADDP